jgi:hypothetical protein
MDNHKDLKDREAFQKILAVFDVLAVQSFSLETNNLFSERIDMLSRFIVAGALLIGACFSGYAQEVIRLWEGKAPGSEQWTHQEAITSSANGIATIRNVVDPSMTAYLPNSSTSNGIAVIVCPGGAFRALSWESEGVDIARRLNKYGIAAFVLKYRLLKTGQGRMSFSMPGAGTKLQIKNANANPDPNNEELNNVIKMAISDGQQAIRLVRQNAKKWNINPSKIGIMGFSAGGGKEYEPEKLNPRIHNRSMAIRLRSLRQADHEKSPGFDFSGALHVPSEHTLSIAPAGLSECVV